jgi:hypothetical protein
MKKSSKYQCCGITCLTIGIVVLGLGCFFTLIMDGILVSGSKKAAALVPDTYDQWGNVPGEYDIAFVRNYYLFHCTNHEDVRMNLV